MDDDWFDIEVSETSEQQRVFIGVLQDFARSWPECPPDHTLVLAYRPGLDDEEDEHEPVEPVRDDIFASGEDVVRAVVDVSDLKNKLVLRTLCATMVGDRLVCSQVHDSTPAREFSKDVESLEATGSPQELGRIAAAWFEEILRRPVIAPQRIREPKSFASPGSPLPPGYVWIRNAPHPD
ncbi:hypothetical protein [Streptomyces sp. NPDC047042]|uniref:hypothetical protein n=1 Tax=Streptomyces sp. NPDC047042 TaxID=3154807 RepID=UPI0033C2659B